MASADLSIRPAKPEDIPSINKIHTHYVLNTVITFVTEPNSDEATLSTYHKITTSEGLPYLVATCTTDPQKFLGYTYVSSFRGVKPGYRHTLELSLFCAPDEVRKGVGARLLDRLVEILREPEEWRDWFEGTRLLDSRPRSLLACMAIDIEGPGKGLALRDWYLKKGLRRGVI